MPVYKVEFERQAWMYQVVYVETEKEEHPDDIEDMGRGLLRESKWDLGGHEDGPPGLLEITKLEEDD